MSAKRWSLIALFMSMLIMSLPVVSAQSLSINKFSGSQNIDRVAKDTDTITVKVLASIPSDAEITPGQVRLINEEGVVNLFSSCAEKDGGVFECSMTFDVVGTAGQDIYTVALFDDDNVEVSSTAALLTNDAVDPDMIDFTVNPTITGGSTTISYHAKDYAVIPGDTEACAGVGSIKLYENGVSGVPTATIPGGEECDFEGTYSYAARASGDINLCAIAVDRIGRSSGPLCTGLTVDKDAPLFTGFRIFTPDGFTVRSVPPEGTVANIEVYADEFSIDGNSVRADFRDITGKNNNYASIAPTSITEGPDRVITWYGVLLKNPSPCEFTVTASDTFGNDISKKFTCTLSSDTTGPQVTKLSTGFAADDGTPILGKYGTLTGHFNEAGGMERANAFIDASFLGVPGSLKATRCFDAGSEWRCEWHLAGSVPAGTYSVSVFGNTADDLGNEMGVSSAFNVQYDAEPPILVSGPDMIVLYPGTDYGGQIVHGSVLQFTAEVTGAATVQLNASGLGLDETVSAPCGDVDGKNMCVIQQAIEKSGTFETKLTLEYLDTAGNKVTSDKVINAFGLLDEAEPDYWKSKVACSPKVLDRSMAPLVEQQVYCRVKLTPKDPDVKIAATTMGPLDECVGELSNSVVDIGLINNGYESTNPYMRLLLSTREFPEKTFALQCPINIFTQIGDSFTEHPEREMVAVSVDFGLTAKESLADSIDKKVEKAVEDAEDLSKWLDAAMKIVEFAEKICQVRTIIWNVIGLLEVVLAALGVLSLVKVAGVGDSADAARQALCCPKEVFQGILTTAGLSSGSGGNTGGGGGSCGSGGGEGGGSSGGGSDGQGGTTGSGGASGTGQKDSAGSLDDILEEFCNIVNCQIAPWEIGGGGYGEEGGGNEYSKVINEGLKLDPKQSLVVSLAMLCIPGIIYNVDKYRQIQCRYAVCMKRDVQESGIPISVCDDEKAYLTCIFVWGQVFNTIPYSNIVKQYTAALQDIISNPFAALSLLAGSLCKNFCTSSNTGVIYTVCSALKVIDVIGRVLEDYNTVKDKNFYKLGQGSCEELEDL